MSSYVELSRDNDLISLGAPKVQDEHVVIAKRLKTWFEKEKRLKSLLIFDNADKINNQDETQSIVDLIPRGQSGCVLATSRNPASDGELANAGCEVEEMRQFSFSSNALDVTGRNVMSEMPRLWFGF